MGWLHEESGNEMPRLFVRSENETRACLTGPFGTGHFHTLLLNVRVDEDSRILQVRSSHAGEVQVVQLIWASVLFDSEASIFM